MTLDPDVLRVTSLLGYLLVFAGGVLTSIGPCNVAMIPLVIAFVGGTKAASRGRSFALSSVFVLGLSITYVLLGLIAALIGGLIGGTSSVWYYVVAGVCLLIGLQMLGVITLPAPAWLGDLPRKVALRGLPGALLLGLISGLVASQCATPVLAAIITYVLASRSTLVYGAVLLFIYALGRGVPVVLAGTFAGVLKELRSLGRWSQHIERASGVIILLVGLYFVWIA
ncbi:MAG: cytochrome c biogenesis CcdA family protein [Anaerolineae bacterium]